MILKKIQSILYYSVFLNVFLFKNDGVFGLLNGLKILLNDDPFYLFNLKGDLVFKVRDLYDVWAIKEIFNDEVYKDLFQNLKNKTTFVDIGAYIGDTIIYARKFKQIKKIIAIEPQPRNQILLKNNLLLNDIKNVILIEKAVSKNIGNKSLYTYRNNGQSGFWQLTKHIDKTLVKTITLSQIIAPINSKNIILKCDCEGSEYEIFTNTPSKIFKNIGRIILEYHMDDKKLVKFSLYLETLGYKLISYKNPIESNLGIIFAFKYS
jgi:FkbM family methyltransferase